MRNIITRPRFSLPSARRMPAFALALLLSAVALAGVVSAGVFPGNAEAQTPPAAPDYFSIEHTSTAGTVRVAPQPDDSATEWQYKMRAHGDAWGNWVSMSDSSKWVPARTVFLGGRFITVRGYLVSGLDQYKVYNFQVRKKVGGVWSPPSYQSGILGKTRGLRATPGNGVLHLDWDPMPGTSAFGYRSNGSVSWNFISGSNDHTTGITITGLQNGTSYTYDVRPWTHQLEYRYATVSGTPSASQTLTRPTVTANPSDTQVALSWTAQSDATAWQVRYRKGNATHNAWTTISGSSSTTNSHTVTGLDSGAWYTFQVRPVRTADGTTVNGPASPEASAKTGKPPKPSRFRIWGTIVAGVAHLVLDQISIRRS